MLTLRRWANVTVAETSTTKHCNIPNSIREKIATSETQKTTQLHTVYRIAIPKIRASWLLGAVLISWLWLYLCMHLDQCVISWNLFAKIGEMGRVTHFDKHMCRSAMMQANLQIDWWQWQVWNDVWIKLFQSWQPVHMILFTDWVACGWVPPDLQTLTRTAMNCYKYVLSA